MVSHVVFGSYGFKIHLEVIHMSSQAITYLISSVKKFWPLFVVYVSPIPSNKRSLWEHVDKVVNIFRCPWLITGDFNEIISINEKQGGSNYFSNSRLRALIDRNCFMGSGFISQNYP